GAMGSSEGLLGLGPGP
nr:Chain C, RIBONUCLEOPROTEIN PTB-BINDING 1 [Mus musculus]3ZZZ_D Chain D, RIBONUCLEOPROTEIN PTB-BINDING 1 [Mus musculus]